MNFEQLKEKVSLKDYADEHLERRGNSKLYVCPFCGSGNGPNKTAAFSVYGDRFKCFSCQESGDIFDLAGKMNNTSDRAEQYKAVAEWAGISEELEWKRCATDESAEKRRAKREEELRKKEETERKAEKQAEEYIVWASGNIENPEAVEYLSRRGFTVDEAKGFGLGYDPESHGIVIPYGDEAPYYYTRRSILKETGDKGKYYKPAGIREPRGCLGALNGKDIAFVVEGMFDALSVRACGYNAIALNGTANATAIAQNIVARGYDGCVAVLLDNDKAGDNAAEIMLSVLENGGVASFKADGLPGNDPADVFSENRGELRKYLEETARHAIESADKERESKYAEALKNLNVLDPVEVMQSVWRMDDYEEPIPTGLNGLDRALGGGFRTGLAVIGAISSMGKTTLALQIADFMAESGRSVLFVTIEQSARELVSKSLSRIMRRYEYVVPDSSIRSSDRFSWSEDKNKAFYSACQDYANATVGRLNILEGIEQPSVSDVHTIARSMADHDGKPPVVFIDYLQLLASPDDRITDKQATDRNITALRQMARKLKTTVVVISSLNRSSYSGVIDLDSFKESGGIEYGADLLLGLQPYNMKSRMEERKNKRTKEDEADEIIRSTKAASQRECEIVILKNRSGRIAEDGIPVCYLPASNVIYDGTSADIPSIRQRM